jgi:rubrerythrin
MVGFWLNVEEQSRRNYIMAQQAEGMTKALSTALKMESDGMAFYKQASQRTNNSLGKKMFESFIEDEKRHFAMIEALGKGLIIDDQLEGTGPAERIQTVFSEARENIDRELGSDPSDVEALKFALSMEDKGWKFYKESAETAKSPDERKLFEVLAQEESQHHEMLQNALSYLEQTGDWYLWEEGGPIEGG